MKLPHTIYYVLLASLFLGTHQGRLALWKQEDPRPLAVYPCTVSALPAADQELLARGIPIQSEEELTALLEDLLS